MTDRQPITQLLIEGKKYSIYLWNGWKYTGKYLGEDKDYIRFYDERSMAKNLLPKTKVLRIVEESP